MGTGPKDGDEQDPEDFGGVDPCLPDEEIEIRAALGYEVRKHASGRTTASKRSHQYVMDMMGRLKDWRLKAMKAAYEGREAMLEPASSEEHFGMAPEGQDSREWLLLLEEILFSKSVCSKEPLNEHEADLRTAFLLGIREAVSHLESAEIEQLERRKRGGLRTRKREGWLKKLLKSLWHPDLRWPSTWEELANWLEGADEADCAAAGLVSVSIERTGKKAGLVAEFEDGPPATASRESVMRAKNRLRAELDGDP